MSFGVKALTEVVQLIRLLLAAEIPFRCQERPRCIGGRQRGIAKGFTTAVSLQSWHSQLTLYARNIPSAVYSTAPEAEQVMLEACRDP
jgi:hypothetical protein